MATSVPQILVVDDEPHLCAALHRLLQNEGYGVTTAREAETALELVKENEPDVILLDIMMPGMDGREVCRRVRETSSSTRVLYFTAKVESADPLRLRELRGEADGLIAKPATAKRILFKIESVLQGVRS